MVAARLGASVRYPCANDKTRPHEPGPVGLVGDTGFEPVTSSV